MKNPLSLNDLFCEVCGYNNYFKFSKGNCKVCGNLLVIDLDKFWKEEREDKTHENLHMLS